MLPISGIVISNSLFTQLLLPGPGYVLTLSHTIRAYQSSCALHSVLLLCYCTVPCTAVMQY